MKEVVEIEKLCKETGLDSSTVDILDTVLDAAGKLAKEEIEPINKPGDNEGLKIDSSGKVTTAAGFKDCLLYTSPSPRDGLLSRMPSSA